MTDIERPADAGRLAHITEGDESQAQREQPEMATDVLSPRAEPGSLSPNANRTSLPPLVTSPPSKAKLDRQSAYINKRLSTISTASNQPSARSRPQSAAFPIFHSSLPYTLVRDFAYGPLHPLFYGPLPEQPSNISTPASEVSRRLSDPPPVAFQDRGGWSAGTWDPGEQLPQTTFVDGPPWSEDEDLHSPIVTNHPRHHKKHKSNIVDFDQTRGRKGFPEEHRRGPYAGSNSNGNDVYYVSEMLENGGGDYITYPPSRNQGLQVPTEGGPSRRDSHFAALLPQRTYASEESPQSEDEEMSEPEDFVPDESRFSRDYQFTIASPEEEMLGKAVALYDFTPENYNELELVEGQIVLISFRHGRGWLVARDPRTGQDGLVPEQYVRLLRDIEGGWSGLMHGSAAETENTQESIMSPGPDASTPTQAEHSTYTPVISTFSTTTRDLEPYPKEMLGTPTTSDAGSLSTLRGSSKDRSAGKAEEPTGAGDSRAASMEGMEPTSRHATEQQAQAH
ncbi:hypothetical protein M011DRAFT_400655 [Sporormia fimetaria CBS 119925]|uniref:SH3 domain-containing protein n=1 Tax=Sporormia fimetaria CBS 119925 TaxID=1340428 RepID=A0A6A6VFA9_9PLEO|nr:hypothetical protein M011DRAFT_400655 [Sporormia fimetaria CBS 119925]